MRSLFKARSVPRLHAGVCMPVHITCGASLQVKIRDSMKGKAGEEEEPVLLALPPKGTPSKQVMARMRTRVRPPPPPPAPPQPPASLLAYACCLMAHLPALMSGHC